MTWLTDPKLFNYVLMGLCSLNAARWAIHGSWGDALFWAASATSTAALTWGYAR